MATDEEIEIHRALRDSQNQYVYFLLGAAGAAIALVINQTRGAALSWSQIPLGAAVLAWGLSFYFGCRNRTWVAAGLRTNTAIFEVQAGRHPVSGTNLQAIAVGLDKLREIFEDQSNHAKRFFNLQFRFLIAGAVLYLVWHVLEMYLRSA